VSTDLKAKLALFDPSQRLESARTIPSLWYADPEIYRAECRAIFHDTWQVAGRLDQLRRPGSFFTAEIAGEPILVVRGEDGVIRAFYNVCRHRAARVAIEPEGHVSRLRCRYHGWTYDLCGRLRGVPEFEGVAEFRREDNGLPPVAVATWGPLVFVHTGPDAPPLTDFLRPLPEKTSRLGLDALRFVERRTYDLACNWKVYVENYLDGGYHVNTIHPGLAGVLDYTGYRTEIADNTAVQISPMRPPDPKEEHTAVGTVRTGDTAYYWWLFPNFMVNIYQGVMDTNLVLPLGPDRCRVIFDFYFAQSEGPEAAKFIAESIAVADKIQQEDGDICEDVQRGLGSRSFKTGRFSVRREAAVYHFHRLLANRLAALPAP
jgi:choline monooxygenase